MYQCDIVATNAVSELNIGGRSLASGNPRSSIVGYTRLRVTTQFLELAAKRVSRWGHLGGEMIAVVDKSCSRRIFGVNLVRLCHLFCSPRICLFQNGLRGS